jgi:hypothetical protein
MFLIHTAQLKLVSIIYNMHILTNNTSLNINIYSLSTINAANIFTGQDPFGSHEIEADVLCTYRTECKQLRTYT